VKILHKNALFSHKTLNGVLHSPHLSLSSPQPCVSTFSALFQNFGSTAVR